VHHDRAVTLFGATRASSCFRPSQPRQGTHTLSLLCREATLTIREDPADRLGPYVPRLVTEWLRSDPNASYRRVDGTLAFVDISGFTSLTERLARRGKVGAEEMNDVLDRCFSELLAVAYADGAGLVKWGGDAVLLLFEGDHHAARACRAAAQMQRTMRAIGRFRASSGPVALRMSVGVHSGGFDFFLVGGLHRELVIAGPAATRTVDMESTAKAGQVLMSTETASMLPQRNVGERQGVGYLLRGIPEAPIYGLVPAPELAGLELERCLPVGIREHVMDGTGEPEHRQLAVAFIEYRGVDAMLERTGPVATARALDSLIRAIQEESARQQVTFFETDINADGGKILLVAGAPRTYGDDEERMLTAGRRIVEQGAGFPIRVGVNAGRAFAGDFGPRFRRTYSIKGDAVNLAARVMGKALIGQLLATQAVVSRARTPFRITALEPFMVKGKSQPVLAFDVGPVATAASRARTRAGRPSGPLVGREHELSVLGDALAAVRSRQGRVVELVGEPGHGKSRLVAEVLDRAPDLDVFSAACQLYEQQEPYSAFRVMIRGVLGLGEHDAPEPVIERLRTRIAANAPDLVPWLPLIGIVLDLPLPSTPETEALAEEFRRTKLQEVVLRFLEETLPTPTIFVFEDAHWMDDASTDLLRLVAREAVVRPWFLLITRRGDEGRFRAPLEPHITTLPIGPLDDVATAELARATTEDDPLRAHDLEVLVQRAGGNPLFLRELISAARDAGSVDDLPGTVEALVATEIDRLAPADRAVVRQAAVLGARFDLHTLEALYDEGTAPTPSTWQRLEALIVQEDEVTFRFTHALLRDAAYEGLPYRRRRTLHGRAADAIASTGNADEHAEVLSLHYHHAGVYERSLRYSALAGDRALAKFALVESAAFYLRAIEAARRADAPAGDLARLCEALGDVQERIGRYGEANAAYRAARVAIAGDAIAEARLLLKQAWIPERAGRYADALRWIRRGQHALEGVQGSDSMRLRAQLSVWYAAVRQGQGRNSEAIRWCRQAIEQAEASDEWDALAHAYFILDWAYVGLGRYDDATHSVLALEIYERLGNLGRQATIWNNLGAFAYWGGRWDEALQLYEKGREARRRLGDVVDAAMGTNNIGEILSDQGRLEEAEALFREALRVWKAAKFTQGVAFALSNLGRVASRSGRYSEADGFFAAARDEFVRIGAEGEVLEVDTRIAESYVLQGRFDEALDLTEDTLRRARLSDGVSSSEPALLRIRGCALLRAGDLESAAVTLVQSLDAARRRESDYDRALALWALEELSRIDGQEPILSDSEAQAILARLGVVRLPPLLAPQPVAAR
jgi:class 3 adenylate cyclase/tetratricopeptide (TPR) repeat protein